MTTSIGIIGCGWLGTALAQRLLQADHRVIATCQSEQKQNQLAELGINAELLALPLAKLSLSEYRVFQCDTLVIAIPPMIRQGRQDYPEKIAQLVALAEQGQVRKIILISTTAIYQGLSGSVVEDSALKTESAKVKLLVQAEQKVLNFSKASVVLRCAGLIGGDRHPGRFFNSDRVLREPDAHVNLIHQTDVVAIVYHLIGSQHSGIFNAVADVPVSKQQFYALATQALKLPIPKFEPSTGNTASHKVVGDKLLNVLNYHFHYRDIVSWLSHPAQGSQDDLNGSTSKAQSS